MELLPCFLLPPPSCNVMHKHGDERQKMPAAQVSVHSDIKEGTKQNVVWRRCSSEEKKRVGARMRRREGMQNT